MWDRLPVMFFPFFCFSFFEKSLIPRRDAQTRMVRSKVNQIHEYAALDNTT